MWIFAIGPDGPLSRHALETCRRLAARTRPFLVRALACLATPLRNGWRSRGDFKHWVLRPRPAHAIFLGDGVSLDRVNGEWQDRFGEPLMAELERRGLASFVMQSGERHRQPSRRPTFSANRIVPGTGGGARGCPGRIAERSVRRTARSRAAAAVSCRSRCACALAQSAALERRAKIVLATASAFERVLRIVKPRLAFVVTYYAGLGAAFLVACRRPRILSVDLQHCPQDGAHKAYGWHVLHRTGIRCCRRCSGPGASGTRPIFEIGPTGSRFPGMAASTAATRSSRRSWMNEIRLFNRG